jgi:hypothetical protein
MAHHWFRRSLFASLGALAALLAMAGLASAHEHRHVGDYELVVGFRNEPAYVGLLNGLDLHINDEDGEPVEGLADTLNVAILYGDQSQELNVRAVWGRPGAYTADVVPTETGTYSFHITGTIEGEAVDETFTGGPETFSEVQPIAALEFPASNAGAESNDNDQAMLFGIGGIVAGLLGLVVGVAAYVTARGTRDEMSPRAVRAPAEGGAE